MVSYFDSFHHSLPNFLNNMPYLFTSESVSEGHPDKVADQISDALIDNFLAFDPESKVACETLVTTGQVILPGEAIPKVSICLTAVRAVCFRLFTSNRRILTRELTARLKKSKAQATRG